MNGGVTDGMYQLQVAVAVVLPVTITVMHI
jgi:hypothetical protein